MVQAHQARVRITRECPNLGGEGVVDVLHQHMRPYQGFRIPALGLRTLQNHAGGQPAGLGQILHHLILHHPFLKFGLGVAPRRPRLRHPLARCRRGFLPNPCGNARWHRLGVPILEGFLLGKTQPLQVGSRLALEPCLRCRPTAGLGRLHRLGVALQKRVGQALQILGRFNLADVERLPLGKHGGHNFIPIGFRHLMRGRWCIKGSLLGQLLLPRGRREHRRREVLEGFGNFWH